MGLKKLFRFSNEEMRQLRKKLSRPNNHGQIWAAENKRITTERVRQRYYEKFRIQINSMLELI